MKMTDQDGAVAAGGENPGVVGGNVEPLRIQGNQTRVDLPPYRSFESSGKDIDELAADWKRWKRGLEYYIDTLGMDKTRERSRLKNMVLYLVGERC